MQKSQNLKEKALFDFPTRASQIAEEAGVPLPQDRIEEMRKIREKGAKNRKDMEKPEDDETAYFKVLEMIGKYHMRDPILTQESLGSQLIG